VVASRSRSHQANGKRLFPVPVCRNTTATRLRDLSAAVSRRPRIQSRESSISRSYQKPPSRSLRNGRKPFYVLTNDRAVQLAHLSTSAISHICFYFPVAELQRSLADTSFLSCRSSPRPSHQPSPQPSPLQSHQPSRQPSPRPSHQGQHWRLSLRGWLAERTQTVGRALTSSFDRIRQQAGSFLSKTSAVVRGSSDVEAPVSRPGNATFRRASSSECQSTWSETDSRLTTTADQYHRRSNSGEVYTRGTVQSQLPRISNPDYTTQLRGGGQSLHPWTVASASCGSCLVSNGLSYYSAFLIIGSTALKFC